jgi:hypothetical protein
LGLIIRLWGCTGQKKVEAPKQERIEKSLVPAKAEVKGQNFSVELSDPKMATTVDTASKEIIETPSLSGGIKITHKSNDILDTQGVTLECLDEAGKPIPFNATGLPSSLL